MKVYILLLIHMQIFNKAYFKTCKKIIKRINEFYDSGVIVINENDEQIKEKFIKDWDLQAIDIEVSVHRLYQPRWLDRRFANNMIDFMLERIQGVATISFITGDNFVMRHGMAEKLSESKKEFYFIGSQLKVFCDNIQEAKEIADLVNMGKRHTVKFYY